MKKHFIVIFSILLVSSLLSCSDSERRLPYVSRYATVKIQMTLPDEAVLSHMNIIDRVLRFFSRDAIAQTAPATFSGYTVRVTASGMIDMEKTFTPAETMTLTVPAGSSRRFEVTAIVDPSDPSAALSFRGITTLDLVGETVTVPVIMNLHETKIVIPDPGTSGNQVNRLVQINDITGAGWIVKQGSDIGFSGTFRPWAIDFDNRGRIYIANNNGTSGSDCIIRINNINDTACVTIGNGYNSGIASVAVDRTNSLVYYSTDSILSLRRCNLDGTGDISLTVPSALTTVYGLTVDSNGTLYIIGLSSTQGILYQYNPLTQTEMATYTGTTIPLDIPEDVEIKAPYIYIANRGDFTSNKIVRLDANLSNPVGYGTWVASLNTNPGMFYNPRRFVGIRNDALIIIDEANSPTDLDKLVSIQDIYGTGWTSFGSTGYGTNQFYFFYGC